MADWSSGSPGDNDIVSQFPTNERAARAALITNFGVDHYETNDANIGKHDKVTLLAQGSDPTAAAGQALFYSKDAGAGVIELYMRDEAGNVLQLTAAGGIRAESLAGTIADARLSANVALYDAGAGMLGDIGALADPGADRILGWDETADAVIGFSLGTGLAFSGTNVLIDTTVVPQLGQANTFTAANTFGIDIIQTGTSVRRRLVESDGAANNQVWLEVVSGERYFFGLATDAAPTTIANAVFDINRTGTTIDSIAINANTLDFNGAADFSSTVNIAGRTNVGTSEATVVTPELGVFGAASANLVIRSTTNDTEGLFRAEGATIILGATSNHALELRTNNTSVVSFAVGGAITTANVTASEVGYKGVPRNNQDGNYTCVLTDANKLIYKGAGGAGETYTIPANASVAYPIGTTLSFLNHGGGTLTIAITSDIMELAGVGTTGSRTLANFGLATAYKYGATSWVISGTGLS